LGCHASQQKRTCYEPTIFTQIAHDAITGVGLLWQRAPEAMKAFASLATAGTAANARHQDQGADGALHWHHHPLRRLRSVQHQDGPPAWRDQTGSLRTVALAVYRGGVGTTSLACASAVLLGDAGRRVLIVSTAPQLLEQPDQRQLLVNRRAKLALTQF
jgi:hypothetical protein